MEHVKSVARKRPSNSPDVYQINKQKRNEFRLPIEILFEILTFAVNTKTKNDILSTYRLAETCVHFRNEVFRLYRTIEFSRIENISFWKKAAEICYWNSKRSDIDEEEANQWELVEVACRKQAYFTWGYYFVFNIPRFRFNIHFIDPFNEVPELRINVKFCMECLSVFNYKSDSFFHPRPFNKKCNHFICTKCLLISSLIHFSNFPNEEMACPMCDELNPYYFEITHV